MSISRITTGLVRKAKFVLSEKLPHSEVDAVTALNYISEMKIHNIDGSRDEAIEELVNKIELRLYNQFSTLENISYTYVIHELDFLLSNEDH